jgi:hypothetical protein
MLRIQNDNMIPSGLHAFTCIDTLVSKYGFSQELMHAIKVIKPELFPVYIRSYNRRLIDAQTVYDPSVNALSTL